jgi:hypothetical protein
MPRGHGYSARLTALATILLSGAAVAASPTVSPSGRIVFEIHDAGLVAEITGSLQTDLVRLGFSGRVQACSHAVHLLDGRPDGDHFFGAICSLDHGGRHTQVMMCDDRMVGHFALVLTFAGTREDVVRFTDANCAGG